MPMLDFDPSADTSSTSNVVDQQVDVLHHQHHRHDQLMNQGQLSPATMLLTTNQQQHHQQHSSPQPLHSASSSSSTALPPVESSSAFDASSDPLFIHHHQLQSRLDPSLPQQQQQQQQQLTQPQQHPGQPHDHGGASSSSSFDPTSSVPPFDISAEIKRIQQFHQFGGTSNAPNALILQGGGSGFANNNVGTAARSNNHHNANASMSHTDANLLLQSMLDAQKVQNPRFDNPLSPSNNMGIGSSAAAVAAAAATSMTNPLLQPAFFQDPRFLSSLAAAGNPNLLQFNPAALQVEVPLPSPHSVFHRDGTRRMRGGVIEPFPEKLHRLLLEVEAAGRSDVISFVANGRAFAIHKPEKFFKEIVPLYFRQSRLSSFKRQLNLYGFELINSGPARGGYFHESFVKDQPELCRQMRRVAIRGSKGKVGDKDDDDENHHHHDGLDLGIVEPHFADKEHEGPL